MFNEKKKKKSTTTSGQLSTIECLYHGLSYCTLRSIKNPPYEYIIYPIHPFAFACMCARDIINEEKKMDQKHFYPKKMTKHKKN